MMEGEDDVRGSCPGKASSEEDAHSDGSDPSHGEDGDVQHHHSSTGEYKARASHLGCIKRRYAFMNEGFGFYSTT